MRYQLALESIFSKKLSWCRSNCPLSALNYVRIREIPFVFCFLKRQLWMWFMNNGLFTFPSFRFAVVRLIYQCGICVRKQPPLRCQPTALVSKLLNSKTTSFLVPELSLLSLNGRSTVSHAGSSPAHQRVSFHWRSIRTWIKCWQSLVHHIKLILARTLTTKHSHFTLGNKWVSFYRILYFSLYIIWFLKLERKTFFFNFLTFWHLNDNFMLSGLR